MSTVAEQPRTNGASQQPQTQIALRVKPNELATIESIVEQCGMSAVASEGHFGRAFKLAAGIRMLSQAITKEMMADIMALQGSGLGFRTDKDKEGGYKDEGTVKLCFIEAMLLGAYPVGNEFNIIADRPYLTKEFYTRKLMEFPGLTNLTPLPAVPVMAGDKGALVSFVVTCKIHGQARRFERLPPRKLEDGTLTEDERIAVRVNAGMGTDAIIGKATRKMYKWVYEQLTGFKTQDGEVGENTIDAAPAPKKLDDLTEQLNAKRQSQTEAGPNALAAGDRPQDAASPLSGLDDALAQCVRLLDVNGVEATRLSWCKTDEERKEVQARCEQRRSQIRETRGTKGDLFTKGSPSAQGA